MTATVPIEPQNSESTEQDAPKPFDPQELDDLEAVIPDDYISFMHPKTQELIKIPVRMLSEGERMTYVFAMDDKVPKMPENIKSKQRGDLTAEERQQYQEIQEAIDPIMDGLFTDVTFDAIVDPEKKWTRKRVDKLPRSTRQHGFVIGMRGPQGVLSLSAQHFLG